MSFATGTSLMPSVKGECNLAKEGSMAFRNYAYTKGYKHKIVAA